MKKCNKQGTQQITVRDEASKKGHIKIEKSTIERKKERKNEEMQYAA
jgi:hypothetical protein